MIPSQKRSSLFGNNVDHQDSSFSSYLNDNTMILKLTNPPLFNSKKNLDNGEIGIFGAEKYFKGAMDDLDHQQVPRTPPKINPQQKDPQHPTKLMKSTTPSVHSESSCNSRSGLLLNRENRTKPDLKTPKTNHVKNLLTSLGCNCNDNKSVTVKENKIPANEPRPPPAPAVKDDCFSFPVINTNTIRRKEEKQYEQQDAIHVRSARRNSNSNSNSMEGFGSPVLEKGKKSFSLERKLTMLNWVGVTPRAENIDIIVGEKLENINDALSDASSDLFEIESFSTTGNNSFLGRQVSNERPSNATLPYAPSEASIAWSVVTASVAEFSIVPDFEDTKMPSSRVVKGGGINLSGCNSHKSVRVSGEHMVVSGGEKPVGGGGAAVKERCRLDCVVPVMKVQGETKGMSSLSRAHSPRPSHQLYSQ